MKTRKPTGEANWPMLIVEGMEGARKTSEALRLSLDPRIGASYVIEVGERRVDEYASLGDFEVVEHDGHLRTIVPAIRDVMALPPLDGKPNLLIIDSGTGLWDLVKRAAEGIARSSKSARKRLDEDPDAEIEVGHQAWNRAKDPYWWGWLNDMRAWPGIFVMTCRADEVAKFQDGRPIANQYEYRIDVERGTRFIMDATVRMRGPENALVTTAKSLNFTVPPEGIILPSEHPLAYVVFELFQAGTEIALNVAQAKQALIAMAKSLGYDDDAAKAAAAEAWRKANGQLGSFDAAAVQRLVAALVPPGEAVAVQPEADDAGVPHPRATVPPDLAAHYEGEPVGRLHPDDADALERVLESPETPPEAPESASDADEVVLPPERQTGDYSGLPVGHTPAEDALWADRAPDGLLADVIAEVHTLTADEAKSRLKALGGAARGGDGAVRAALVRKIVRRRMEQGEAA